MGAGLAAGRAGLVVEALEAEERLFFGDATAAAPPPKPAESGASSVWPWVVTGVGVATLAAGACANHPAGSCFWGEEVWKDIPCQPLLSGSGIQIPPKQGEAGDSTPGKWMVDFMSGGIMPETLEAGGGEERAVRCIWEPTQ